MYFSAGRFHICHQYTNGFLWISYSICCWFLNVRQAPLAVISLSGVISFTMIMQVLSYMFHSMYIVQAFCWFLWNFLRWWWGGHLLPNDMVVIWASYLLGSSSPGSWSPFDARLRTLLSCGSLSGMYYSLERHTCLVNCAPPQAPSYVETSLVLSSLKAPWPSQPCEQRGWKCFWPLIRKINLIISS